MIHGSCIPLDGGGFVVTVICPNHFSYQRLIQVLNEIVPEAGEPGEPAKRLKDDRPEVMELISRAEQDDSDFGLKAGEAYEADK